MPNTDHVENIKHRQTSKVKKKSKSQKIQIVAYGTQYKTENSKYS